MFESKKDPMNRTATNPLIYPSRFTPLGRDESYPNVSRFGFRDESFYDDSGTQLQSLLRSIDVKRAKIYERFERLKKDLSEWQSVREKKRIAYYKIIIDLMRKKAMKRMDPQNDLAPSPTTLEVRNRNLNGFKSSIDHYGEGGIQS